MEKFWGSGQLAHLYFTDLVVKPHISTMATKATLTQGVGLLLLLLLSRFSRTAEMAPVCLPVK